MLLDIGNCGGEGCVVGESNVCKKKYIHPENAAARVDFAGKTLMALNRNVILRTTDVLYIVVRYNNMMMYTSSATKSSAAVFIVDENPERILNKNRFPFECIIAGLNRKS